MIDIIILTGIYFTPAIISIYKKQEQKLTIALLNAFLGWTIIFWIYCLMIVISTEGKEKEE